MSNKKKLKGLLFGDDIRFKTGVARMLHSLVSNTHEEIEWTQLGGGSKRNNVEAVNYKDICTIYPLKEGYGNRMEISQVMKLVEPDFIFMMTDPRYFHQHFRMEYEIRQSAPIIYYNIWDNYPVPLYNKAYYNSCDGLACINKQTTEMVKSLVDYNPVVDYIPHGVDMETFKPLQKSFKMRDIQKLFKNAMPEFEYRKNQMKIKALRNKKTKFLWVAKNQRRKRPADIIYSYMYVCSKNPTFEKDTALIMHTSPVSQSGTDLIACIDDFSQQLGVSTDNIIITANSSLTDEQLNELYNFGDIFINTSDAEGFGLPVAEAVSAGLGVIHTMTGGIQDQFPYKEQFSELSEFSRNLNTQVPDYDETELGYTDEYKGKEWSIPVYPTGTSFIGAPQTPYIFEDSVSIYSWIDALMEAYDRFEELKKNASTHGREYLLKNDMEIEHMTTKLSNHINIVVRNFKPKEKVRVIHV